MYPTTEYKRARLIDTVARLEPVSVHSLSLALGWSYSYVYASLQRGISQGWVRREKAMAPGPTGKISLRWVYRLA